MMRKYYLGALLSLVFVNTAFSSLEEIQEHISGENFAAAEQQLKEELEIIGDNQAFASQYLVVLGDVYEEQDKYEEAIDVFKDLLSNYSDTINTKETKIKLAHAYLETRNHVNSALQYRELIAAETSPAQKEEFEWKLIQVLFDSQQYDGMNNEFEQIRSRENEHKFIEEFKYLEARRLHDDRKYEEAIDKYYEYLTDDAIRLNESKALIFLGRALKTYAWNVAPGSSYKTMSDEVMTLLGTVIQQPDIGKEDILWALWLMRDYNGLEQTATNMLAEHETQDDVWLNINIWLGVGAFLKNPPEPVLAENTWDRVLYVDLDNIKTKDMEISAEHISAAAIWKICLAKRNGDREKVLNIVHYLKEYVPDNNVKREIIRNHDELGSAWTLFKNEDYANAFGQLESFIAAYPDHERIAEAYFALATCHVELEDAESAAATLDQYKKIFPDASNNEDGKYELARAYESSEQWASAIAEYTDFTEKYPDSKYIEDAEYNLAHAYYEADDNINASTYFEAFKNKYPSSELYPKTLFFLARANSKMENTSEAISYYQTLVDQYPDSSSHDEAAEELAQMMSGQEVDY